MVVAPTDAETLERALSCVARPFSVVERAGRHEIASEALSSGALGDGDGLVAVIPSCRLEDLGDPQFRGRHGLRFPCMSGAMANGIGSVEIVEAMARGGFLGVFGSAGLSLGAIELFEKPDELKAARAAFDKRLAGRKWVTRITPDSKPRLDYAGK